LALRLQASAKTDPPMTIADARDKRHISTSVSRWTRRNVASLHLRERRRL